jgi:glycosyltransferase involved in cell wall biosynthesis
MTLRLGNYLGVRFADEVVCVSHEIAQEIHTRYGRDAAVIPNGVSRPARVASPEALDLDPLVTPYVLAVGRVVPEKGFHVLIDAHRRLPAAKRLKLVIAGGAQGDRTYWNLLERDAKRSGDVILTGELRRDRLHDALAHAAVLVLPSFQEGMSFAALEGFAYGLPTLLSDIPANREFGLPDVCYFPPGDPERLAETLTQACTDAAIRAKLRMAAKRAADAFAVEATAAATYAICLRLVGKPKRFRRKRVGARIDVRRLRSE